MSTAKEWSKQSVIDYYYQHRHDVSDLYPSEKVFLPRVLFPGAKVLDVGCASGGFFNIMRTFEPNIEYTGIDLSEVALELARNRYPEAKFVLTEGFDLPFEDNTFDLVHCTSIFNNEPNYQAMLKEMYRVSNRFVIADIRLLKGIGKQQNSIYNIQFEGDSVEATVPYVVNDADEVANFILRLEPKPKALRGTGYFHRLAKEAESDAEVCMAILLVQKGGRENGSTVIDTEDLPIDFSISGA
ncbi:MAG: class I SAM-dependent methyltransferase [Chloroflexi bacterium]|nr:class I SAM-dependent methyltransferase [Chloroflexota bacterium]